MTNDTKDANKPDDSKKKPVDTNKPQDNRGGLHFCKVNGVEIEVPQKKLAAREILKLAKDKGAIPGKPDDYVLQGEKEQYQPDDLIDLDKDSECITIPVTPTSVA